MRSGVKNSRKMGVKLRKRLILYVFTPPILRQAISYGYRTVAFFLDGGATVRAPPSGIYVNEKTLIMVFTKFRRWQQVYFLNFEF